METDTCVTTTKEEAFLDIYPPKNTVKNEGGRSLKFKDIRV